MKLIDTHCHLNDERLRDDLDLILSRAKEAGVAKMLVVCTDLEEVPAILDLIQANEQIYGSVGVHPHEAKKAIEKGNLKSHLESFITKNKIVALGETGLDYYYEHSPQDLQKQAFQTHIELAELYDLPLIVHTREAESDTIELLKQRKGYIRGVIHCFSGTQWLVQESLDLGFYISISGIITFKTAEDLRAVVKSVPLDHLLIETDAPYLAPIPHRGKRNEPAFIVHTAEMVADLKGISLSELAKITTHNAETLFKLN
jgi:TatD DNase family protein